AASRQLVKLLEWDKAPAWDFKRRPFVSTAPEDNIDHFDATDDHRALAASVFRAYGYIAGAHYVLSRT
ncbi:MAG: hypothetical protein L6R42_006865, partial [Xanthoria sp. 1 TBL-2021]